MSPKLTFDTLRKLDTKELDRLMQEGTMPSVADLVGYEFRGFNVPWAARLIGAKKFKKGFFGEPDGDYCWGYNVIVEQNGMDEPWNAEPNEEKPRRHHFFKVFPGSAAMANKPLYPNSMVIDYRYWEEYFVLYPPRYTVDYLVYPDPDNRDLILAKSYLEFPFGHFQMSHFILERYNESNYPRNSHFLSDREMRTVTAFAEVFIEGEEEAVPPLEVAQNIDRHLERLNSSRKRSLRMLLFLIEYVLPRRSLWPFRPPFSKMDAAARKQLIVDRLQDPRNRGVLRDLAKFKTLFLLGYYGDSRVHESINFEPVEQRAEYQPDKLELLDRPQVVVEKPDGPVLECDVCVIGSGAGGAVVAHNAAAAGKDVILLEEGPFVPGAELSHDEAAMTSLLYKEGGLQSTVDLDMSILQGKSLGGTTTINNAICLRLDDPGVSHDASPDVLEIWDGLGAHVDRDSLAASYDRVEEMIGVQGLLELQEPGIPGIDGNNGAKFLAGWGALVEDNPEFKDLKSGLFRKNKDRCLGCGYCNFGCPYGRKLSMLETYIPKAVEHGARVIVECHAVKIESNGRKASGVLCELSDGRELLVKARSVVVSGGAIGSSVLLMKSGVTGNVGKRFSFNAGTPMFAKFSEPLRSFAGVQMAAYVDAGDFLLETLFSPPMAHSVALPGWFGDHFRRMRAYDHFASAGVLIGTEANGKVNRNAFLRSLVGPVSYKMKPVDLKKIKDGLALLARLYFAAGAEAVYPSTFAECELDAGRFSGDPQAIAEMLDKRIRKPEDLTLNSSHPQGGNPMSDNRSIGAVDSEFRVHGFDNLFVCDASVFPTTIRINPQLTIMAMADYFTHLDVL